MYRGTFGDAHEKMLRFSSRGPRHPESADLFWSDTAPRLCNFQRVMFPDLGLCTCSAHFKYILRVFFQILHKKTKNSCSRLWRSQFLDFTLDQNAFWKCAVSHRTAWPCLTLNNTLHILSTCCGVLLRYKISGLVAYVLTIDRNTRRNCVTSLWATLQHFCSRGR